MCREGKCQQRCDEGYGFLDGKPVLAQHLFEFGEFRLRCPLPGTARAVEIDP